MSVADEIFNELVDQFYPLFGGQRSWNRNDHFLVDAAIGSLIAVGRLPKDCWIVLRPCRHISAAGRLQIVPLLELAVASDVRVVPLTIEVREVFAAAPAQAIFDADVVARHANVAARGFVRRFHASMETRNRALP